MKKINQMLGFVFILILATGNLTASAEDLNIHGFISQGYLKSNQNNYLANTGDGSFQFNEMGINFSKFVSNDLKVGCQFFARDLGDVGNDQIVVNWAFAEYTFKNWLGLRAGIIKFGFALYNDIRDFDSLRTSIFLPASVYNEWLRDGLDKMKGAELFGAIGLGRAGMLKYQIQAGISDVGLDSGTATYLTEVGIERLDSLTTIEAETSCGARIFWKTPLDGLRFGATYFHTGADYEGTAYGVPVQIDIKNTNTYVFSAEYIYRNLKIAVENFWNIGDGTSLADTPIGLIETKLDVDYREPFYVSLGYQFSDWFEASYYYSKNAGENDDMGELNELKEHCVSLRFNINFNWIAKAEVHVMEGKFGVFPDDDGHTYNEWLLFAAKVSYSF